MPGLHNSSAYTHVYYYCNYWTLLSCLCIWVHNDNPRSDPFELHAIWLTFSSFSRRCGPAPRPPNTDSIWQSIKNIDDNIQFVWKAMAIMRNQDGDFFFFLLRDDYSRCGSFLIKRTINNIAHMGSIRFGYSLPFKMLFFNWFGNLQSVLVFDKNL